MNEIKYLNKTFKYKVTEYHYRPQTRFDPEEFDFEFDLFYVAENYDGEKIEIEIFDEKVYEDIYNYVLSDDADRRHEDKYGER